jgi:glucokinase
MTEVVLGIDIGGTNTKYGFVGREGKIFYQESIDTRRFAAYQDLADALYERSNELLGKDRNVLKLKGIGIGAPNGNFYKGTIEFAPNLAWKGIVPLAAISRTTFNVPAFLTNDANAAAIGEMIYGGAIGMKDFVVITLGTGVGSGFVVNGNVMYGHDGFAGEFGHITVDPEGRMCGCGRKGCLETYASATGICQTVRELFEKNGFKNSKLQSKIDSFTALDVTEAALGGDPLALEAFEQLAKVLGAKLANMVAITSPEAIFLFGGLAQAGDILFVPVKKYMEQNLLKIFQNKVKVLPSLLNGSNAAILGAAAVAWKEIG